MKINERAGRFINFINGYASISILDVKSYHTIHTQYNCSPCQSVLTFSSSLLPRTGKAGVTS